MHLHGFQKSFRDRQVHRIVIHNQDFRIRRDKFKIIVRRMGEIHMDVLVVQYGCDIQGIQGFLDDQKVIDVAGVGRTEIQHQHSRYFGVSLYVSRHLFREYTMFNKEESIVIRLQIR